MSRGLFARLLAAMCGVAAASVGLALLLQERSLSANLERAAERRLARAAAAASRLLASHLDAMAERYRAVSLTPQFRALLEVNDGPTLAHYAQTLLGQHGAARIAFLDASDRVVAGAGDAALDEGSAGIRPTGVIARAGRAYAVVATPIAGAGRLLATEPIQPTTLELWSDLCGAQVAFAVAGESGEAAGPGAGGSIHRTVGVFDGLELRVTSSLEAEREAMSAARANLAMAGAVGLALALLVSLVVSRGLVRPIQQVQAAARRIGAGDLTTRVDTQRTDEIGDVARAFEEMGSQLRATIRRVVGSADRVEATSSAIATGATRFLSVTRAQQENHEEVSATLAEIDERVRSTSRSAGRSMEGIDLALDGSTASFRELLESGRVLQASAARLWDQTEEIGRSIDRVATSAEQMASDSDALLPAVEATAGAVSQVAAAASSVNEHAAETSRLAETVVAKADEGRRVVRDAVAGMEATLATIGDSERVIENLRLRSEEIGSILSVIGEVTDETGLLALNASIIAAQAGDHGRPFAVVAGQMKALASRVQSSTQEIESVVRAVQAESREAVAAIAQGSSRAREGALLIEQAEAALSEITRAAREAGDRMGESASSTAEQMLAAGSVAERMQMVRDGMGRIGVAAREQAEANGVLRRGTRSLHGLADDVRAAVEVQTRGASNIGESVETVQRAVGEVMAGLEMLGAAGRQVAEVIGHSLDHIRSHEASAQEMGEAARNLEGQAQAMRAAVERFQIEEPQPT